jgi:TPR repeat protein
MWGTKAAEQGHKHEQYYGHLDAQNNLGQRYFYGEGVEKDYNQAVKKDDNSGGAMFNFYSLVAKNGNVDAQYELGLLYEYGSMGVKQDYQQAINWFAKAAEQGHKDAQKRLEICKAHIQGIKLPWYL